MSPRRTAFTILELLLVIGIMFLLITLAIVAFGGARDAANRASSLNALRQMALGFSSYASDFDGRFMPGFVDQETMDLDDPSDINLTATVPSGSKLDLDSDACSGGVCDRSSYLWRLAPYVGDSWEIFLTDYRSPRLVTRLAAEIEPPPSDSPIYGPGSAGANDLGISRIPSFGMNSIFIGGDSHHGGVYATDRDPWSPAFPNEVLAATRLTQVKNPSRIILFGSCMRSPDAPGPSGSAFDLNFGSPELRPPYLEFDGNGLGIGNQQWAFGATGSAQQNLIVNAGGDFANGGGWPIARWGSDLVPVAHLDGSVAAVDRYLMGEDGSMWAPYVIGPARVQD